MSSFTPSNDDIISPAPEAPEKKRSPLWAVIIALVAVTCCCCLCLGVLSTWFLRFGVSFLSGLFGGL